MSYIILIDNTEKWILKMDVFNNFLSEEYHEYKIDPILEDDRPYLYEWHIKNPILQGFIHKDGDSYHINSSFDDCINFTIALRKKIPAQYKVLFFDSSYNYSPNIEFNTTSDELKKLFI